MAEYADPGYSVPGYAESIADPLPPPEGVFDLDVGVPGAARHRTAVATAHALELAYWQPGSPWAPYAVQPIFVICTRLGVYAFSDKGVPQAIVDQVLSFDTTLVEMDPISFRAAPIASNILGSISAIERSQGRVVINDPMGEWARRMWREAIVAMPSGIFWMIKDLYTVPALTGTVGRISYRNRQLTVFFGQFRRDSPVR